MSISHAVLPCEAPQVQVHNMAPPSEVAKRWRAGALGRHLRATKGGDPDLLPQLKVMRTCKSPLKRAL